MSYFHDPRLLPSSINVCVWRFSSKTLLIEFNYACQSFARSLRSSDKHRPNWFVQSTLGFFLFWSSDPINRFLFRSILLQTSWINGALLTSTKWKRRAWIRNDSFLSNFNYHVSALSFTSVYLGLIADFNGNEKTDSATVFLSRNFSMPVRKKSIEWKFYIFTHNFTSLPFQSEMSSLRFSKNIWQWYILVFGVLNNGATIFAEFATFPQLLTIKNFQHF